MIGSEGVVPLVPEHAVLIPPETPYRGHLRHPVEHLYLHFLLAPPLERLAPAVHVLPLASERREDLAALAALLRTDAPPRIRAILLAREQILWALTRLPLPETAVAYDDERVRRVVRFMDEHMERPRSNDELAAHAHMNTNAFIRLFRRTVGRTPQAFYTVRRIERACVLLHFSDVTVETVAAMTGFRDRYHFSRVFKRLRGMGPAAFRRQR